MMVIAHRGANREALENSWSAYELAIQGGAQRIELDVHLAKDRSIPINHDLELNHTTGIDANIAVMSRKELEKVRLRSGEPLPFLDEVLDRLLPRVELNIEIKGPSTDLAEGVARLVKKSGLMDKVIISSFCFEPLQYLWRHHPELQRACLWGDGIRWPNLAYHSPLVMMQECHANIFHPFTDWMDEELMDQARNRGWRVYPWVSMKGEEGDKQGLWSWLATLGVDGLCTNYPRQFKQWLTDLGRENRLINSMVESLKNHELS